MKTPKYASVNNPTISEIINGYSKAPDKTALSKRLQKIKDTFVTVNEERFDSETIGDLSLWVLGYLVTEPEASKGIIGNYMSCHIRELDAGYHIESRKIVRLDPRRHPHRKHKVFGDDKYHPNRSVPAIRLALSKKQLESKEHAVALLDQLQQDYPEPTIRPYPRILHTIMWDPGYAKNAARKTRKITLSVNYDPEGFYYLAMEDNHQAMNRNVKKIGRSPHNDLFNSKLDQFVSGTLIKVLNNA